MAKQWWFSFFFTVMLSTFGVAQTLLNSFEIPLQRPHNKQGMKVALNQSNDEIVTIVADKYKVTAALFNRAVFLKDTLSTFPPPKNLESIVGLGFAQNQHPVLYHASEDFKTIQSVLFDFNRRATVRKTYNMPLDNENVVYHFSDRNSFSVLTVVKGKDHLKWYLFQDNELDIVLINLENVASKFKERPSQSLSQFLEYHPLEKIDTRIFNPIFFACNKSKFYTHEEGLTFTFDQRKDSTQMVVVNRVKGTLELFHHASPKMDYQNYDSNSFLMDGFLFQLAANKKELVLTIKDLSKNEIAKTYHVLEKETIEFANSELMQLVNNQPPRTFRKTKPFLSALNGSDLGVSVHVVRDQYHVQVGGRKWVLSSGDYFFGVLSAVAGIDDLGTSWSNAKLMYFDTLLDEEFHFVKSHEKRFAQDYASFFIEDERITLMAPTIFYQGGLLMAYYDRKDQRLVLRKFEDDLY